MRWFFAIGALCMALAWVLCGWTVMVPPGWTDVDTLTLVLIISWALTATSLKKEKG